MIIIPDQICIKKNISHSLWSAGLCAYRAMNSTVYRYCWFPVLRRKSLECIH